ncbi:unnamed protein product, partial [Mesorhabditis spiculigera]
MASLLCTSYQNDTTGYIKSYYESDLNRCALYVTYGGEPYGNLTAMCNQIAAPIKGQCQVVNAMQTELLTYIQASLFTPDAKFFLGLVREPDCGAWHWVHYDGSTTLQSANGSYDCTQTQAVYDSGTTKPQEPSFYVNTTGFLCQCYEPATQLATTKLPGDNSTMEPIDTENPFETAGSTEPMGNGTTLAPDSNATAVTSSQQSPTAATAPPGGSAGETGPRWFILIGIAALLARGC